MGPIWGLQDPGGPHVGPMNFVIWGTVLNGVFRLPNGITSPCICHFHINKNTKQQLLVTSNAIIFPYQRVSTKNQFGSNTFHTPIWCSQYASKNPGTKGCRPSAGKVMALETPAFFFYPLQILLKSSVRCFSAILPLLIQADSSYL